MGLYNIIDEITERQVTKTETGDNRIWGVMVGIVAKNYDSNGGSATEGRVCVTIPTRDDKANELKWAKVAMPSGGGGWGLYFLPEVGDQVLLAFEGGNIEKPYVIGCLPKASDKIVSDSVDKDNQFKRIVTRHGTRIIFEDSGSDDSGKKDKLTLETAGQALQFVMDNEKNKIFMMDKGKACVLEMSSKSGEESLSVQTKGKVEFKVGENITLTMDGKSGAVTIKATSITLEGSNSVSAKGSSSLTLEGAQVSANANSALKLSSTGQAQLSGTAITIG